MGPDGKIVNALTDAEASPGPTVTDVRGASSAAREVLKVGRNYVAGKTFDTKREAQSWLTRQRAARRRRRPAVWSSYGPVPPA